MQNLLHGCQSLLRHIWSIFDHQINKCPYYNSVHIVMGTYSLTENIPFNFIVVLHLLCLQRGGHALYLTISLCMNALLSSI